MQGPVKIGDQGGGGQTHKLAFSHRPFPFIAGTVLNVEIDMVFQASVSLNRNVAEKHRVASENLSKQ